MVVVYAASAVLAAGGGVLELAHSGVALPVAPASRQVAIILAAVLGGASLRGGRGMGYGAVVGALAVAALVRGLDVRAVSPLGLLVVLTVALAAAILLDEARSRLLARTAAR